eukprot:TRINITY_DN3267_c0_g1_i2.p1 TRINITY_DN3267_c0_g1~~TRINITY_DN3267_c0_g1_i2.p1  ORF type:complete len:320 (+),score=86.56 TRINITY_DN3267_c0_g1_i2:81-962(+)
MNIRFGDAARFLQAQPRLYGFQLLSDLHLEFPGHYENFHFEAAAPYLLLAGDVGDPYSQAYARFLHEQSQRFRKVFVVSGNHEFYGHRHGEAEEMIRHVCKTAPAGNCTYLSRDSTLMEGSRLRVIGTTLWYDPHAVGHLNDYNYIRLNDGSLITGDTTTQWCSDEARWIRAELANAAARDELAIVLTHHAPRPSAWCGDGVEMRPTIQQACGCLPLWVHGHTHNTRCYEVGKTLVVSNQLGYHYSQNQKDSGFCSEFVVAIDPLTGEKWVLRGQTLVEKEKHREGTSSMACD